MAATPLASSDSATALNDAACLGGHRQGKNQGDTVSGGDDNNTALQLAHESFKPSADHQGNQHDTPNKLSSAAVRCASEEFSPASTSGTTLSGGESAPDTPLSEQFSSQEPKFNFTTSADETDNVFPDDKHQSKFIHRLLTLRSTTEAHGNGVPLAQGKSDSCPDRLASMIHDLERHDRSGSTRSSDSQVTQVRKDADSLPIEALSLGEPDDRLTESPFAAAGDTPVTAEKAQSVYPPEASVFVANLAKDRTDDELLRQLGELFETFGECWILIRRDVSNAHIPFAFVQYKTKDEAQAALQAAPGKLICGRACRVEASRAHRAVYITRKDGKDPSMDEVKSLLKNYKTTEIWSPTKTEIETYALGNGIWVRFELFGECKEAVKAFRDDPSYHLIYKDFDKRRKVIKYRGLQIANRQWRPGSQSVLPQRAARVRPWGSPYLPNAAPATVNMHHGNGSWYNPYSNAASTTPLPPMVSYAQATGQAVLPNISATGALPLLQHHPHMATVVSDAAFPPPNVYAVAHQPSYPQSPVSPVPLSHDQFFFSSQPVSPVSPHGINGTTAFPAFHAPNVTGNMAASNMYVPATHFAPVQTCNIFNGPYAAVAPLDPRTNIHEVAPMQVTGQHLNSSPVNKMQENYVGLSTQVRENTSSPFQGQLPEGYHSNSVPVHRVTHVGAAKGQQDTLPSPTSFGFDGTLAFYVPTQHFGAQALVPGADGELVAVPVPMKVESVAVEVRPASTAK